MSDTVELAPAPPRDRPAGPAGPKLLGFLRTAVRRFIQRPEAIVLIVLVVVTVFFAYQTDVFLTEGAMINVAQATGPTAIVAVGMVFLLVCGEIDLSVGIVAALAPYLMYFAIEDFGLPAIPAILLALAVAAVIGFGNGFISMVLRVPSLITTLGTFYVLQGVLLTASKATPVPIPASTKGTLQEWLGHGPWASILWCLGIVVLFHIVFTRTRWGLHTVAVGGNLLGAAEAGVRVTRIKIGNFMIVSTLGAFAGLLEAFRINSIDPNIGGGTNITLRAIAAAVIGGTALAGGSGTVIGALLGMFVLAELQTGFNILGFNANSIFIYLGGAILASMIVSQFVMPWLRRAGRL